MLSGVRTWGLGGLVLAAVAAIVPAAMLAADRTPKGAPAEPAEVVEMFSAIEGGRIDVKVIPKDSTRARVFIENKTDKPLSVQLPAAFAGVPVLAQLEGGMGMGGMGMGGMGGGRDSGGGTGGGNQAFGGGMGGMGGGMGGMGGGMWNVPPEKIAQFSVPTVCLEHGKPDPRPAVPYKIVPIDQVAQKPEVAEVCAMLATGQLSQRVAQVAAWHLNNDMSWQELASKQLRFANGRRQPYFSQQEIFLAMQLVERAAKNVRERQQQYQTPSQSTALSQN